MQTSFVQKRKKQWEVYVEDRVSTILRIQTWYLLWSNREFLSRTNGAVTGVDRNVSPRMPSSFATTKAELEEHHGGCERGRESNKFSTSRSSFFLDLAVGLLIAPALQISSAKHLVRRILLTSALAKIA